MPRRSACISTGGGRRCRSRCRRSHDRGVFISQIGDANVANVAQTAPNAYARVGQNGDRNDADVAQRDGGTHYVQAAQTGDDNFARVQQSGSGQNVAYVAQTGSGNWLWSKQDALGAIRNGAQLTQTGDNNDMALYQSGSDNLAALTSGWRRQRHDRDPAWRWQSAVMDADRQQSERSPDHPKRRRDPDRAAAGHADQHRPGPLIRALPRPADWRRRCRWRSPAMRRRSCSRRSRPRRRRNDRSRAADLAAARPRPHRRAGDPGRACAPAGDADFRVCPHRPAAPGAVRAVGRPHRQRRAGRRQGPVRSAISERASEQVLQRGDRDPRK